MLGRGNFDPFQRRNPPAQGHPSDPPPDYSQQMAPNTYGNGQQQDYAPPNHPPPGYNPHNWEAAVPDTSLLPPPPSIGYQSSTNNATEEAALAGKAWCDANPLWPPMAPEADNMLPRNFFFDINLEVPDPSHRPFREIGNRCEREGDRRRPGVWHVKTNARTTDTTLLGNPPLYRANVHRPRVGAAATGASPTTTIYYEVQIGAGNSGSSGGMSDWRRLRQRWPPGGGGAQLEAEGEGIIALGFAARPYPGFRMPGWERGSLAVHGDDGRRYINNSLGGKPFAGDVPFMKGQTVGIGMTFVVPSSPPNNGFPAPPAAAAEPTPPLAVEIFVTKDGSLFGVWNLHEERDAETDGPVTGLEGFHDLCAAIGVDRATDFRVYFHPEQWKYQPARAAYGFA